MTEKLTTQEVRSYLKYQLAIHHSANRFGDGSESKEENSYSDGRAELAEEVLRLLTIKEKN